MKRIAAVCILTISFSFFVQGQRNESEIALREYFNDAEFFLTQEFYLDALNDYMQIYKRGYSDNANINYRIGICYLGIPGQKDKAIGYLEKASKIVSTKYKESSLNEKNAPIDVYLYLGNAYRVNDRLDEAIKAYNKYKELLPADETNLHVYADKQIEACNIAHEFMDKPVDLTFENLGDTINTTSDDYNPVISGDGSTLVFMHKLPFYEAIYFSKKVNGKWQKPVNITPQIMSDGNQYVTGISYDGKTILLSVENEFNSDIYMSQYTDNRWTQSRPLGSNINTKYWESHASLSKDGNTLYFTSNRNGGAGNMDIYVAKRTATGNFGQVQNVKEVNSDLNEDTPFVTADGQKLYFSSQGFVNMGGYDIFESTLGSDGKWSVPENLGYPVSTTDDDLFYYPWQNGNIGYMSKIIDGGYGAMDIYKVKFNIPVRESISEEVSPIQEELPETAMVADTTVKKIRNENVPETAAVQDTTKKSTGILTAKEEEKEIPVKQEIRTVEISPIFFEFDKSVLSEKGKQELDKLIGLLNEFPGLKIRLSGFADALGPESYNLRLSERRALTALNYLVSNGINGTRLTAIGKGETEFIAPNTHPDGSDNPEGRRFNRRVEFEITGTNPDVLIIKRIDPVPKELRIQ
jgi:outer membrane protein OmpA-like peptidoglycan-associated protein/tetratricopeptide (TPR) repeat protein